MYLLENLIEFNDTSIDKKRAEKRRRDAEGKNPILIAVETRKKSAGFIDMHTFDTVAKAAVNPFFAFHLKPDQNVQTDALPALNAVAREHVHEKQVTPPKEASEWLPLVHIMIGNMKKLINGTFHEVPAKYLQEYLA